MPGILSPTVNTSSARQFTGCTMLPPPISPGVTAASVGTKEDRADGKQVVAGRPKPGRKVPVSALFRAGLERGLSVVQSRLNLSRSGLRMAALTLTNDVNRLMVKPR